MGFSLLSGQIDLSQAGARSESLRVSGLLGVATLSLWTADGAWNSGSVELKSIMGDREVSLDGPVTASADTVLRGIDVSDEAELALVVTAAASVTTVLQWWLYVVGP